MSRTGERPESLTESVARQLGPRHRRWIAVRVTGEAPQIALQNIGKSDDVELGSVSKALTGMLYAEACEAAVRPECRLDELLPLQESPAGAVTLASLATHTSGLPRLAADSGALAATWRLWREGRNPYGSSLETLLERTRQTPVGRPRPSYSNLGFMLLGHAVAAACGTTYPDLLAQRLAAPLGLLDTTVPASAEELSARAVPGTSRRGSPVEAWTGTDLGPAGGVRSSARDLARLLTAILDGTAPGLAALDPVSAFAGGTNRVGAGWMTMTTPHGDVTWHNGGTGGFRSIVTIDRAARTAVAVVTATSRSVDAVGFDLVRSDR